MLSSQSHMIKFTENLLHKYSNDSVSPRGAEPLKAQIINTPLVPLLAISNDEHLLAVDFIDTKNAEANIKRIVVNTARSVIQGTTKPLQMFAEEVDLYFKGKLWEFQTPIELKRNDTEFRLAVWQQINAIPFGETKSYAELAKNIGNPNGYRAVANACGTNPLVLIVPCHRVTGSKGELGGFSSGIEKKKWLLAHEKKLYEY